MLGELGLRFAVLTAGTIGRCIAGNSLLGNRYGGSGRAKCNICGKIIKKGTAQVNGYSYQTESNCHLKCLLFDAIKKELPL